MMEIRRSIPSYVFIAIGIMGLYALLDAMAILKEALLPLCIAIMFSILLQPLVSFLEKKGVNRILAILIPLTFILCVVILIIFLLLAQLNLLVDAWPELISKWDEVLIQFTAWVSEKFDLTLKQTELMLLNEKNNLVHGGRSLLAPTIINLGQFSFLLLLVPIYVFMLLYYKTLFMNVVFTKNINAGLSKFQSILIATQGIIKSYLSGLLIESGLVAILNIGGLLLLGIDYAILLGLIGGALNMLPYIGGLVAMLLPILVAVATKPIIFSFYILLLYTVIQIIDNNLIMPYVVASKVQLNGLVSVFVVILGEYLWGISGMFFSIPATAILKVFCDHYPGLEIFGKLLGTQSQPNVLIPKS